MCDQLMFEMNELKLRLNEIGEVKEKNVSIVLTDIE